MPDGRPKRGAIAAAALFASASLHLGLFAWLVISWKSHRPPARVDFELQALAGVGAPGRGGHLADVMPGFPAPKVVAAAKPKAKPALTKAESARKLPPLASMPLPQAQRKEEPAHEARPAQEAPEAQAEVKVQPGLEAREAQAKAQAAPEARESESNPSASGSRDEGAEAALKDVQKSAEAEAESTPQPAQEAREALKEVKPRLAHEDSEPADGYAVGDLFAQDGVARTELDDERNAVVLASLEAQSQLLLERAPSDSESPAKEVEDPASETGDETVDVSRLGVALRGETESITVPSPPVGAGTGQEGGPASAAGEGDLAALIRARVEFVARLLGPSAVERFGHSGTAAIRFQIDAAGYVGSMEVVRSSGAPALDSEALTLLHLAEPYPPLPGWITVGVPFYPRAEQGR